jgi:hypothetical protein
MNIEDVAEWIKIADDPMIYVIRIDMEQKKVM